MSKSSSHFFNALIVFSAIIPIFFVSCGKNSSSINQESSQENFAEVKESDSAEQQTKESGKEEKKIVVPPGIPSEAILEFNVPEFPERKRESKILPPIPSAPESVKSVKPCREEYDEGNKVRKFYDEKERLFHEVISDNIHRWTEYTERGSKIYQDNGSYLFYIENDEHGNETYFLSRSQERFTENSYDGDSCTSVGWNYMFRDDSEELQKFWRKSEGDTLICYSVDTNSENDRKEESWMSTIENKPLLLKLNCCHNRITQKNFYREYWDITEQNELHPETGIRWYWDDKGNSYKETTTASKDSFSERKKYISTFREDTDGKKQWNESIMTKDFLSENTSLYDGSVERTLQYEDKYRIEIKRNDDYTIVSFSDKETGRKYSVYATQNETNTEITDERTNKQTVYRAYYDYDSRTSSHHKPDWSNGELEWIPIYEVTEVNSEK